MTLEVVKKIALISGAETGFRKELNEMFTEQAE